MSAEPKIRYQLSMPEPHTHYFHVEMRISDNIKEKVVVKMPVWTPGSYLIREFSRHIPRLRAYAGQKELIAKKIDKNSWEINTEKNKEFIIKYRVYAYEQTVRTSFLNNSRGYLNGTSIFVYIEGRTEESGQLKVIPFRTWRQVSTGLPKSKGQRFTFNFSNYDVLVDSPILIGNHDVIIFKVNGIEHEIAIYGNGNINKNDLRKDFKKIVESTLQIFGSLPYEKYVFQILLLDNLSGGLEHINSTTIQTDRWIFSDKDLYFRFLSTVAHEFFHTWNVKRIRPIALGPFNYNQENYTKDLWISEGITSYYDNLILLRSGILNVEQYFNFLARDIAIVEKSPGRQIQSVAESSFDAWIKYYRQNEESPNVLISYYSKGAIIGLLLDLAINSATKGQKSIDDVFRKLNNSFKEEPTTGFTSKEFREVCELIAGTNLEEVWRYTNTTDEIDYNFPLLSVGCEFQRTYAKDDDESTAYFGFSISGDVNPIVKNVRAGTPAYIGGLNVNDEIISLNGTRVSRKIIEKRLQDIPQGSLTEFLISREGIIQKVNLTPSKPPYDNFSIKKLDKVSNDQKKLFQTWLGVPWKD